MSDIMSYEKNKIGEMSVNVPIYKFDNVEWLVFREAQIGYRDDYCCECQIEQDSVLFGINLHKENHKIMAVFYGNINIEIESKEKIKIKNGILIFEKPVNIQIYRHFIEWNSANIYVKVL